MRGLCCSHPQCPEGPAFKVAAPWSDEHHHGELKTYGFACHAHLEAVLLVAHDRRASCRPSPGEEIGDVEVYRYEPGKKDRHLQRLHDAPTPSIPADSCPALAAYNPFDPAWN